MTTHSSSAAGRRGRPSALAILLVPVAVALVLTLFAWPSARMEPRGLPVGVAGPAAATAPVERQLAARDDAFDVERYADEAAARRAIENREVYGAFVAAPSGAKLLVSSAASPAVAQMLTASAGHRAGTHDATPVQDVVPASKAGAALPSSILPLVLGGIITGVLASVLANGSMARRAGLVAAGSVLAGLTATAVVHGWLGVVDGDWIANAAALSLMVLAIAAVVTALHAALGEAGVGLAALTMILVGNPFAAVGSAPELLPQPAGAIGQLMPPGAGGNLLRSTGLFDGAGAAGHVAVLSAWALAGFGLMLVAAMRDRRRPVLAPAAA